jgi:ribonuclease-3
VRSLFCSKGEHAVLHARPIFHFLRRYVLSRIPFRWFKRNDLDAPSDRNITEQFFAAQVQKRIGYRFSNPALLIQALKHRSYVYAQEQNGVQSNERLEFLGDAVLDLVVSEHLYQAYPKRREGRLTQMRSCMVNRTFLAEQAHRINLGKYLLLSPGEARSGGRQRFSILADAYEAVIGAMYMDGGIEPVRTFLRRTLLVDMHKHEAPYQWRNYKSVLLEYTQSEGKGQPRYRVESEEGPDHEKLFTVEVYIAGTAVGRGSGTSKKDAEQSAARNASERLNLIPQES